MSGAAKPSYRSALAPRFGPLKSRFRKIRVDIIGLLPETHPLECRSFKNQPRAMGSFLPTSDVDG